MKSLNRFQCIGNIGRVEIRQAGGNNVAEFSVALTERTKSGEDKTEWVNVVAWEKLADIVGKYCQKGSRVYCEGKLTTRTWEKDGAKRSKTEVVLRDIVLLDSKTSSATEPSAPRASSAPAAKRQSPAFDDDLPF